MKHLAANHVFPLLCALTPKGVAHHFAEWYIPKLLPANYEKARYLLGIIGEKHQRFVRKRHGDDAVLPVNVPLGYKLFLPVRDDHFSLRRFGLYHPESVMRTLQRMCPRGARVCEIGSHVGETSLYFAKLVGPEGHLYTFEIDDQFSFLVQKSTEANGYDHVTIENKAIGKPGAIPVGDGYCDFLVMMKNFPELNYASGLGTEYFTHAPKDWNKAMGHRSVQPTVERVDLFDVLKDQRPIDFFFMDIEGCEVYAIPMILRLAKHWKTRPKIMFEVHHNAYSSEQAQTLREGLIGAGYSMSSPDRRHVVCE